MDFKKITIRFVGHVFMSLIVAFILQAFWNEVIPGIFKLKKIDYQESFYLLIISDILFRGKSTTDYEED